MGGLSDLADVVNKSAVVNIAQLTGLDNGSVMVPTYDWQSYFSAIFTKLKGIFKNFTTYGLNQTSPGTVFVRDKADSPEVSICLLRSPDILQKFRGITGSFRTNWIIIAKTVVPLQQNPRIFP